MSVMTEFKLTVSRTINTGNYENVKIEASSTVARSDESDTPEAMRGRLMDEVSALISSSRR